MSYQPQIVISTKGHGDMHDLTEHRCAYGHEQAWHDGNGHSHLQATLLRPSLTVPIAEGRLVLGSWQRVFHLECDVRGRQRTIVVTVVGD